MDSSERRAWLIDRARMHRTRILRSRCAAGGILETDGRRIVNLSSNDYLDLARDPRVVEGAAEAARCWGAGAGASRLMSGTLPCHEALEAALARMKGYPCALVFGSGYTANLGLVDALCGRETRVFADRLAHASLLDGVRLSGARLRRFRHNDAEHLRALLAAAPRGSLVLTESVFSMDGDLAPLGEIADVCLRAGATLLVDEAHATGVVGPRGAGAVRGAGVELAVPLCMGTLSKALGSFGGFVACSEEMRDYLFQASRPFVYSTALPPPSAGAALAALQVLEQDPGRPERLAGRADYFRGCLRRTGLAVAESPTPIVPVRVGSEARALRLAAALEEEGILAVAVRPPTVPSGTSRLRFSVTLAHTEEDLSRAASVLARVWEASS